jgi:hypothetical protein
MLVPALTPPPLLTPSPTLNPACAAVVTPRRSLADFWFLARGAAADFL